LTLGEELEDEHEVFEHSFSSSGLSKGLSKESIVVTKYTKYSKKDADELQESAKSGAKSRRRRKKQERRRRRKKKERRRRRKKKERRQPTRAPTKDTVVNRTPEGYIGTCDDKQSNRKERHAKPKTADECRPLCAEVSCQLLSHLKCETCLLQYDYFMIEADLDCACYDVNPCAGRGSGDDIAYHTVLAAPTEAPTKAPTTPPPADVCPGVTLSVSGAEINM